MSYPGLVPIHALALATVQAIARCFLAGAILGGLWWWLQLALMSRRRGR